MSETNPKNNENQEDAAATTESQSEQIKADLDKAKKEYLYLMAEFDTYRRNAIKERSDLSKYGAEKFIREFLNVFDNFERAMESEITQDNIASFREGVKMIAGEFKSLLDRFGVQEVQAEGQPFDPTKHEALSSEPRADMAAGHVSRVFKKAYKYHDRLLRPAQVTVASAPQSKE